MSAISIVLVIIVAFLAGMEGVLDEFQFHPAAGCVYINWTCDRSVRSRYYFGRYITR